MNRSPYARIGIFGLEDTFLGDVWDEIEGAVPLAKQFGGWVKDNATIPGLIRLVGGGVITGAAGWISQVIEYVPGGANSPAGFAAKGLFISLPSIIEGKPLAAAIVAEFAYQLKRAGAAYVAAAPHSLGLTAKAGELLGDINLPPEIVEGGARAAAFLQSAAGNEFVSTLMKKWFIAPIENLVGRVKAAKDRGETDSFQRDLFAAEAAGHDNGLGTYVELEKRDISPEGIAKRTGWREDATAIGLNAVLGRPLYDPDWFDAATGRFHTDPAVWRNNYALAESQGAGAGVLREIKRRWDAAAALAPERGVIEHIGKAKAAKASDAVFRSPIFARENQGKGGVFGQLATLALVTLPAWGPILAWPYIRRKGWLR